MYIKGGEENEFKVWRVQSIFLKLILCKRGRKFKVFKENYKGKKVEKRKNLMFLKEEKRKF